LKNREESAEGTKLEVSTSETVEVRGEICSPEANVLIGVVEDTNENHVEHLRETLNRFTCRIVGRVEESSSQIGEETCERHSRDLLTQSSLVEEGRESLHEMLAQSKLSGRSVGGEVGEAEFHFVRESVDERISLE
jgi:hypothetical protein